VRRAPEINLLWITLYKVNRLLCIGELSEAWLIASPKGVPQELARRSKGNGSSAQRTCPLR